MKTPLLPSASRGAIKLMPVSLPACNDPRNSQTAPAGIDYHGSFQGWNSHRDLCVGRLRPEKTNRLRNRGESRAGLTLPTAPPMPRAGMTERETEKSVGIGSLSDTAHTARQNMNISGVRQDGPKGFFAFRKQDAE